jgi:hypothetical protein
MSDPTEHPPSPIPVPYPLHPPYDLEPSHPLYNHIPRELEREQQADVQARWDIDWAEFDRRYQQIRSTRSRREQTRQRTEVPETDLYGFAPGDPMYGPHLRYTPGEFDDGDGQRGQGAMPPVEDRLPPRGIGRPEMAPSQSGNGYGPPPQSMPRPPSPPPIPYRPTDMHRDLGHAGYGHPGSRRSAQQDLYQEPRYPTQRRDAGASTSRSHPPGGGQGYVNLTLGDEHLDIWDWSED